MSNTFNSDVNMRKQLHNILSFLSRPKPPEPERIKDSGMKTFDVDAILRKLGGAILEKEIISSMKNSKEQLPYGQWRCDHCDHVNNREMIDCHHCGAPKPKQHTQEEVFPSHHNIQCGWTPDHSQIGSIGV